MYVLTQAVHRLYLLYELWAFCTSARPERLLLIVLSIVNTEYSKTARCRQQKQITTAASSLGHCCLLVNSASHDRAS